MTSANESASTFIFKVSRSRAILLDILRDQRGMDATNYDNFSNNEIRILYNNQQLNMLLTENTIQGVAEKEVPEGQEEQEENLEGTGTGTEQKKPKKIFVMYHLDKMLRPNNVSEYVEELFKAENVLSKDDDLIIITKDEPNDSLVSSIKTLYDQEGYFVTIFSLDRLQFNVTKHVMVPKHRIMTDAEIKVMSEKYNIMSIKQLPEISRFDPVAQAIGLRPKQVCHITRSSRTAMTTDYYRVCL